MKIAIMQPYLFPYIGYFQLISAVDIFVNYDDVNFINKGWINRNHILLKGKKYLFTIPLKKHGRDNLINKIEICNTPDWRKNLLNTIELAYKNAPFFKNTFSLLNDIICRDDKLISSFVKSSITHICDFLEVKTEIIDSSSVFNNQDMQGQARILDICEKQGTKNYINLPGGRELYNKKDFAEKGINLLFLEPSSTISYNQCLEEFVPNLSIVDILMFNSKKDVQNLLDQHSLSQ